MQPTFEESIETQNVDDQLIYFNLKDEKLSNLLNRVASYKKINLILPQDHKKIDETTVTFSLQHKISVAQAWSMLLHMLDIAGYSIFQGADSLYTITQKTTIGKEPAPLFINVPPPVLPNSDEIVRYIYYFQNINLNITNVTENLNQIIKDMLPSTQPQQEYNLDKNYNALIITHASNNIKALMNILQELDQSGFRETIEVIPIIHTTAKEIENIINQLIPRQKNADVFQFPPLVSEPSTERKSYFSASTRIISIGQTNSVAILGTYDSVQRIKDFIRKYLDKSVDAEKSVLHVKPLKYLDAKTFKDTLTNLISRGGQGPGGQQATAEITPSSVLVGVKVEAEETEQATLSEKEQRKLTEGGDVQIGVDIGETTQQGAIIGGNSLVIAANNRDWKILDKLIDQLDTEQWQVAIEVLIVDITIESTNALGTQLRRLTNDQALHEAKWQSAQVAKAALDYPILPPDISKIDTQAGLEADLLSSQSQDSDGNAQNIANQAPAGSTILTFKDKNGISMILQLLRKFEDVKIISKPFVIAQNNEQANILSEETHWLDGNIVKQSMGGTPVQDFIKMVAATKVAITPRISTPPDNINLEIRIDANDFLQLDLITKRTVLTNANVGHNEVLVLGGISKLQLKDGLGGMPLLCRIPIIGNLFKNQSAQHEQRNLVIFVAPSRIPPVSMVGSGINKFTRKQIDYISQKMTNSDKPFESLQDPITNFLFHPEEGKWMGQALQYYASRGVWTEAEAGSQPKQKKAKRKTVAELGKESQKETENKSSKIDLLKEQLKNEKNPLTQK